MKVVKRKISELIPADYNPRRLTEKQEKHLTESLTEFGLVDPVIVNMNSDRKNIIIGGHQRLKVWQKLGNKEIDCVELDLSIEKEKELNIRLNANTGEWDIDLLLGEWEQFELESWGLTLEWPEEPIEIEEDDFDVDGALSEEPETVLGDLYEIGEHRLLCGDSTCSDTVAKLMDGVKADMVFTDPPYLMDFTGGIHADGSKSYNSKHGAIKNDKMSESDGNDFLDAINYNISLFCKGAFYIFFYRLGIDKYFASLSRTGLEYRALIIWDKGNHTLSNSDYMSKYEPIFYGWVDEHVFYGGHNGMDIWDIKRTSKNDLHPTMKPIPLCEKGIVNSSKQNDIVLDLFLGSGSTMVASHQLKRKCYGLELDPKYCDVIVKRMIALDENLVIKRNGKVIDKSIFE